MAECQNPSVHKALKVSFVNDFKLNCVVRDYAL